LSVSQESTVLLSKRLQFHFPGRWYLTAVITLSILGISLFALMLVPDVDGIRLVIRITARSSLLLFGLAFTASALHHLWPCRFTQWLRANRRYVGVAFAASHAVHLAAIAAFARSAPAVFAESGDFRSRILGTVAYGFIVAMALTSSDAAMKFVGMRGWRVLHTAGAYYIWLIFFLAHLKRTPISSNYWIGVTLLLAMMALRLIAAARQKIKRSNGDAVTNSL